MKRHPLRLTAAAVVLLSASALSACGDSDSAGDTPKSEAPASATPTGGTAPGAAKSGDRPSVEQLAKAMASSGVDTEDQNALQCLATVIYESDLSDELLQNAVSGNEDFQPSEADQKIQADVMTKAGKECMPSSATPQPK